MLHYIRFGRSGLRIYTLLEKRFAAVKERPLIHKKQIIVAYRYGIRYGNMFV